MGVVVSLPYIEVWSQEEFEHIAVVHAESFSFPILETPTYPTGFRQEPRAVRPVPVQAGICEPSSAHFFRCHFDDRTSFTSKHAKFFRQTRVVPVADPSDDFSHLIHEAS
jgi:hypothetical protein